MNFRKEDIHFIKKGFNSKFEVIEFIAKKVTSDSENYHLVVERLNEREFISTTGFGNGVAIPHARVKNLQNPIISMWRLKEKVNWESLDGEPINLVFCILVPENSGDAHIEILGNLANLLLDQETVNVLKTSDNKEKIALLLSKEKQIENKELNNNLPYYLAVSACTFGLAHTYLAEEKLKQYADNNNFNIKVETHGVKGDLNLITSEDLKQAKGVILAVDKNLDLTHIKHKNIIRVRTTDVLKDTSKIFDKLNNGKIDNKFINFLKLDLFKNLNFISGNTFNLCYILGLLIGISLYVTSFESTKNNVFFTTIINVSQYAAILAPTLLLTIFVYKILKKDIKFALTIFAISASLTEYNYITYGKSSYGLIGTLSSLIIVISLMWSLTFLNKKLFLSKEKSFILDTLYYGFSFIIEIIVPLLFFLFLYVSYEWLAFINAEFYNGINKVNNYWWFRWIIASLFLLGMAWDSGGVINKWSLLISAFLFYDSFAYNSYHIWMTPITATAMGIVIPCAAAWVRGRICWNKIDELERKAVQESGNSFIRSISEGFLFFRNKYGWKTLLAHLLTSLVVGWGIGFVNLQFFGGFNNIFGIIFSFSIDNYSIIPNLMYFVILIGGSLVGGTIHTLCYLPTRRRENEEMKDSLYPANTLG